MINLVHLNTYRHLIEVKSFTGTAIKLNMTQPGVSQHVRWLEEYFGEKLIQTVGKKFEVTPKGHDVYLYAVKIFNEHETFKRSLKVDEPTSGFCRISSPGGIGIGLYSKLLKVNQKHPNLSVQFHYAPNKSIENDLIEDKLDLGFMTIPPQSKMLNFKRIGEEKLLLILPKTFKCKTYADLESLGFINHPDGRDMLEKVFSLNFPEEYKSFEGIKISGGSNQIGRILEPVALGLGFTVLPHFAFDAFRDKARLSTYPLKRKVVNDVYLVKKRHRILPARFDFLIKELSLNS